MTVFEDRIHAAIYWLQASLREYGAGQFEAAEENLDTAIGFADDASAQIGKTVLEIHTQAQKEPRDAN